MKILTQLLVIISFCFVGTLAIAQSANDNGTPTGAEIDFNWDLANLPSAAEFVACPPVGPVMASFTGATTQQGRIFRDGVASTCPTKVYPGIFNAAATFNYETFTYSNTDPTPACVTINFDTGSCAATFNAHMSAYVGSYDPTNQGANFLGDVGSSVTQPFAFEVPGNSDLVLVVTNTNSQEICDFAFEVLDLPCTDVTVPTMGEWALICTGMLLLIFGVVAVGQRQTVIA